jgi:hypothetical protein
LSDYATPYHLSSIGPPKTRRRKLLAACDSLRVAWREAALTRGMHAWCADSGWQVCGLKWSYDGHALASGGNDNHLLIWSVHGPNPLLKFKQHTAAIKAIAWSPHQHGLLASGGGTQDRCIRFWNTSTNTALQCVDTGSQVREPRGLCVLCIVCCGSLARERIHDAITGHPKRCPFQRTRLAVLRVSLNVQVIRRGVHIHRRSYYATCASARGEGPLVCAGSPSFLT